MSSNIRSRCLTHGIRDGHAVRLWVVLNGSDPVWKSTTLWDEQSASNFVTDDVEGQTIARKDRGMHTFLYTPEHHWRWTHESNQVRPPCIAMQSSIPSREASWFSEVHSQTPTMGWLRMVGLFGWTIYFQTARRTPREVTAASKLLHA